MNESKAPSPPQTPANGDRQPVQNGSASKLESAVRKPLPAAPARKPEIGGPKGPEPTRYGDWEKGGRCIDF